MYAKNELILLIGYSAWMICYKNLPHRKKNPMLRRAWSFCELIYDSHANVYVVFSLKTFVYCKARKVLTSI